MIKWTGLVGQFVCPVVSLYPRSTRGHTWLSGRWFLSEGWNQGSADVWYQKKNLLFLKLNCPFSVEKKIVLRRKLNLPKKKDFTRRGFFSLQPPLLSFSCLDMFYWYSSSLHWFVCTTSNEQPSEYPALWNVQLKMTFSRLTARLLPTQL